MDPDPQSYILSEVESQAIFERDIVPAELGFLSTAGPPPTSTTNNNHDISSSSSNGHNGQNGATRTPLAVLLIGQTGAGKTRTAPAIKTALSRLRGTARLAHFVADTYKTYHPSYHALLAARPSLASPATSPDARRWLLLAAQLAASRRADVLVESAARHAGDFAGLARALRGAGYRVEVAVLAVPAGLSRLGILARYHGGLPEAGPLGGLPVRLTPRRVHDESYEGLLRAAAFVDAEDAVDQVVVVRRGNMVAYANERVRGGEGGGGGAWKKGPGVVKALQLERRRPLTLAEKTDAEASLRGLRDMNIPGLKTELEDIEGMLKPLMDAPSDLVYAPLKPLSLPSSAHDEHFDAEAGLRLGTTHS